MKKTLSALLICAMAASLAACGNSTATTTTTAAGEAKAETAASNGGGNYILKVNTALSETDPLFVALTDVFKKNVEEKTNGDIQPILLTEKLVLQCGFNQLDDYTFDNDEMEITQDWDDQTVYYITTHANEYTVSGHRIEYLHQLQNAYFCLSGGKEFNL